tara:strand:- start:371613 stop:372692 length:1080 start_codon:yes stop_codon:yes gene_type:complete
MRTHLLLLLVMLFASCKSSSGRGPAPAPVVPISEPEAQALASELTGALTSCDEAALARLVNWEWMFRTAARASGAKAKQEKALYEVLRGREGLGKEFLCEGSSQIAFVGLRTGAQGQGLVYRMDSETGPNYIEFSVGKEQGGPARCLDRHDYRSGLRLSELLATGPRLHADVEALAKIRASLATAPREAFEEAKNYTERPSIYALAVVAAAHIGEREYRAALGEYEKRFPGDLSVYVQALETLSALGEYQLADEALLALQAGTNDADGLLSARVALLLSAKNFSLATELAEKALAAHPEQQEAHYRLLEVHVLNRNFAGAVAVMRLLGERFNVRFSEEGMDTSHPAYVELLASDEWSAY